MAGEVPTLVGTDNKAKMSKSLNNCIFLSDDEQTVNKKVRSMYTDPKRVNADIPGTVEGNPVFIYHDCFNNNKPEVDDLKNRYITGTVGDGEVKDKLALAINKFLQPMRERYAEYENNKGFVEQVIVNGTERMRQIGDQTMREVRKAMGLKSVWNKIGRGAEKYRKNNNI